MDLDLDLNQEPPQSQEEDSLGRLPFELEDYHGRIEERMHQLESVVARARERLFSQNSSFPNAWNRIPSSSTSSNSGEGIKPCKIDGGAHLLAEALATDSPCQKSVNPSSTSSSPSAPHCKSGGSVFDCNVCFTIARNPVLTCCGHLFCWPCFYSLPNSDSDSSKECPVCQGEVLEADVTPIYGAASESNAKDQCFKIPPRPRGRRIPTLSVSPNHQRLSRIFRAAPSFPTQERIRQLSVQVGPTWNSQPLSNNTFPSPSQVSDTTPPSIQPQRFSRLSAQALASSAMSLSSHEDAGSSSISIRQYEPIVNAGAEMNSSHGLPTATDGSNSRQTTRNRSLYSRRRASSGIGLAVRTQRGGDGFGS